MKFASTYPHEGIPYGGSKRVYLLGRPKSKTRTRAVPVRPLQRAPLVAVFNDIARRIPRVKELAHVYFAPRSGRHYVLPHPSTANWAHLIGVYTKDVNLLDLLEDMQATDYFTEAA